MEIRYNNNEIPGVVALEINSTKEVLTQTCKAINLLRGGGQGIKRIQLIFPHHEKFPLDSPIFRAIGDALYLLTKEDDFSADGPIKYGGMTTVTLNLRL